MSRLLPGEQDPRLVAEYVPAFQEWFLSRGHVVTSDGEVSAHAVLERFPGLCRPPTAGSQLDEDDQPTPLKRGLKRLADWRTKGRMLFSTRTYLGIAWYEISEVVRFELTHPNYRNGYAAPPGELIKTACTPGRPRCNP